MSTSLWGLLFLVVAGVGAGLTGTIAGLASLVSYPALLAVSVPPVTANITNTVAMLGNTIGVIAGSRPELVGQRDRLVRLCLITAVGGAVGGALLLLTPGETFTHVVPWLVAGASVLLLASPLLARRIATGGDTGLSPLTGVGAFLVAIYGGYFGAAAGVIMLALLSTVWTQSLARTNAVKNVATGAANLVAGLVFVLTGQVYWPGALALCAGLVVGSWLGPAIVRRVPAAPLRIAIGVAGLGLAASLAWQAWQP
ncbi:sulfite exporter TauE/SafE family protein [Goodfellowiella coeruleoviolacea]|uniref:Probable membrane transporter protein n=1 Tax=Goodfellowiella coeruleoviolacea TaxID=334858 RepID=A0AAE3KEX2_9PSEU|nr:sulfite exporter TauE/SafE family protein [Goodfellowiella coeruleoviolacea]MCP2164285.1 hypothetical protein [Goodfellowiella coeruleoviolacea]